MGSLVLASGVALALALAVVAVEVAYGVAQSLRARRALRTSQGPVQAEPGDRVAVVLGKDYAGRIELLGTGVYCGMERPPDRHNPFADRPLRRHSIWQRTAYERFQMPKIVLDCGLVVYGSPIWWGRTEDLYPWADGAGLTVSSRTVPESMAV